MTKMFRVDEDKSRKRCPSECGEVFKRGDIVMEAYGSAYMGNVSMRWWHLSCWVKQNVTNELANLFFNCECGKIKGTNDKCKQCKRLKVVSAI